MNLMISEKMNIFEKFLLTLKTKAETIISIMKKSKEPVKEKPVKQTKKTRVSAKKVKTESVEVKKPSKTLVEKKIKDVKPEACKKCEEKINSKPITIKITPPKVEVEVKKETVGFVKRSVKKIARAIKKISFFGSTMNSGSNLIEEKEYKSDGYCRKVSKVPADSCWQDRMEFIKMHFRPKGGAIGVSFKSENDGKIYFMTMKEFNYALSRRDSFENLILHGTFRFVKNGPRDTLALCRNKCNGCCTCGSKCDCKK